MNSPKPVRRSTRLAHLSVPVPLDAYMAAPEDSEILRGDSMYVGEFQSRWARALFPNLHPVRRSTRPSRLRPVPVARTPVDIPSDIPDDLPVVLPVNPPPILAPFMEIEDGDTFALFWHNFPPALPLGLPPSLPTRDSKRTRLYDGEVRNVKQKLSF